MSGPAVVAPVDRQFNMLVVNESKVKLNGDMSNAGKGGRLISFPIPGHVGCLGPPSGGFTTEGILEAVPLEGKFRLYADGMCAPEATIAFKYGLPSLNECTLVSATGIKVNITFQPEKGNFMNCTVMVSE